VNAGGAGAVGLTGFGVTGLMGFVGLVGLRAGGRVALGDTGFVPGLCFLGLVAFGLTPAGPLEPVALVPGADLPVVPPPPVVVLPPVVVPPPPLGVAHVAIVIVLVSSVTAPLRASALPWSVAAVVIVIDVRAMMLPTNVLPVPIVAELPTCQ
jgi:hypothetical protein